MKRQFQNARIVMNKHGLFILASSFLGIGFYIFLFYSHFGISPSLSRNFEGYVLAIIISSSVSYSLMGIHSWMDQHISWKMFFLTRFGISVLITMAISFAFIVGGVWVYLSIISGVEANEVVIEFKPEIAKVVILLFFTALIFNTTYFGFYSYRQYSIIQISKLTQERKQLRLQFEALKSQLSPHYLFNSLNTISSLIYKDASAAEEFIRRLALTFKYVITTDKQKLVPLKEEIEFVKSYYHLLKVRFGNALNLEIDLGEDVLLSAIPPLTLQILVENAVKHNQFDQDSRLEIKVDAVDDKFIYVSNNKLEDSKDVQSFRVGLDNIRKRYSFYSNTKIQVEDDIKFRVQLPLLKLQLAG